MTATNKEQETILNIYKQMYLEATPSVDFEAVNKSVDGWFLNFFLPQNRQDEIIEEHLKGVRFTPLKKQMIRNTITLQFSPKG